MPGKGYRSVGIKEEVYIEIKKRAQEEKKSISMYLVELLEREGKTKGKWIEDLRREIGGVIKSIVMRHNFSLYK